MVAQVVTQVVTPALAQMAEQQRLEAAQMAEQMTIMFKAEMADVKQELADIKKGVVMILGKPISDFDGVSSAVKEEIEQVFECVPEETIKELQETAAPDWQIVKWRKQNKASRVVASVLGRMPSHAEVTGFGQFVAGVVCKGLGVNKGSAHHPALKAILEPLAMYYFWERKSSRAW